MLTDGDGWFLEGKNVPARLRTGTFMSPTEPGMELSLPVFMQAMIPGEGFTLRQ